MSGYFARLAAQVKEPAAPVRSLPVSPAAAMAQHVETEATPAKPVAGEAADGLTSHHVRTFKSVQSASPVQDQPGSVPGGRMPVSTVEVAPMPVTSIMRQEEAGPTFAVSAPALEVDRVDGAPANHGRQPPPPGSQAGAAPAGVNAVDSAGPSAVRAAPARPAYGHVAMAIEGPAMRHADLAREEPLPAVPAFDFPALVAHVNPADKLPFAPSRSAAAAAAPGMPATPQAVRHEVRIGTVTLSVHPPAVTAPVASATPQALPPAAAQAKPVALHRHYLRGS